MTFNEVITRLDAIATERYPMITDLDVEAISEAIKFTHRCQKIQEILKDEHYDDFDSHNYYGYYMRVQDIRKVLEDGKND